jgi:CRP/FNR family transcriptional regulator, anaerobic regulatory protein
LLADSARLLAPPLTSVRTSQCQDCSFRKKDTLCGSLFAHAGQQKGTNLQSILRLAEPPHKFAHKRRTILRANEPSNSVVIIYDGWACTYIQLPRGCRQILRFLLPGDITSGGAVFQDYSDISIEAITDLHYCVVDKVELGEALRASREVFDAFSRTWMQGKNETERLAADLGHRTAEERIARLIANLLKRHSERHLAHDGRFPFPLRLQHIADATGLTVVHVSRVIGAMRKLGLIRIERRFLAVLDQPELENISNS